MALCVAMFATVQLVTACSTSPVSATADKIPPRLVNLAAPKKGEKVVDARAWDNGKLLRLGWDRPSAFGPVPKALQAVGNAVCQKARYRQALGYHPNAIGYDGKTIAGGGYFCGGGTIDKQ